MEASPVDDAAERDTAEDWRIPPQRSIATVAELEGRIDVALATARTAEEAALEIGAASLAAAEQARRAAALAESASASAARAAGEVAEIVARPQAAPPALAPPPRPSEPPPPFTVRAVVDPPAEVAPGDEPDVVAPIEPPKPASLPSRRQPDPFDERLTAFRERAESVMIRLQRLEAGTPPGDGTTEVVRLR